jgi:hypothetical protein
VGHAACSKEREEAAGCIVHTIGGGDDDAVEAKAGKDAGIQRIARHCMTGCGNMVPVDVIDKEFKCSRVLLDRPHLAATGRCRDGKRPGSCKWDKYPLTLLYLFRHSHPLVCKPGGEERTGRVDPVGEAIFVMDGLGNLPEDQFVPCSPARTGNRPGLVKNRGDVLPVSDNGPGDDTPVLV